MERNERSKAEAIENVKFHHKEEERTLKDATLMHKKKSEEKSIKTPTVGLLEECRDILKEVKNELSEAPKKTLKDDKYHKEEKTSSKKLVKKKETSNSENVKFCHKEEEGTVKDASLTKKRKTFKENQKKLLVCQPPTPFP